MAALPLEDERRCHPKALEPERLLAVTDYASFKAEASHCDRPHFAQLPSSGQPVLYKKYEEGGGC
jgi:hypothetical protein